MRAWHVSLRLILGPSSSARTVFDRLAAPLFAQLGYRVVPGATCGQAMSPSLTALLDVKGTPLGTLVVTAWNRDTATAWRDAVLMGIGHGLRWCFCINGHSLRVFDGLRTYSRQFVEFNLEAVFEDERTFGVFWGLLRAAAMAPRDRDRRPLLDRAVVLCDEHRARVRSSLQV